MEFYFCEVYAMGKNKRKDTKGHILRTREYQRPDGRYVYSYVGWGGKRQYVYAKTLKELRQKEEKIQKELESGGRSRNGRPHHAE